MFLRINMINKTWGKNVLIDVCDGAHPWAVESGVQGWIPKE